MSTGVISIGYSYVELPDLRGAFARAKNWFGGNLPEAPKVWDSGDRYTPVLAILDKFVF